MCGLVVHVWTSGAVVMELFLLCSGLQSYLLDKAQTGVSGNGAGVVGHYCLTLCTVYTCNVRSHSMYSIYMQCQESLYVQCQRSGPDNVQCIYVFLMRDEKEGRKKQARSNKQTRQSNTQGSHFS